ncbi:MAG: C39 family peptidase [Christensenellales bacterium]
MNSINFQLKKTIALLIILTLLLSIVILCFQTNDIVKAEISNNLTQDEIDIALGNLYCKFEDNEALPELINAIELYDFNGLPLYALYNLDNYYMVVIRQTGTILERGEGCSKFEGMTGKLYYGKFFEAYQEINGNTYDSNGLAISNEQKADMINSMNNIRELDYYDYLEAMQRPQVYGASNRNIVHMLGGNSTKYYYFAEEINIFHQYLKNINNVGYLNIERSLYTDSRFEPRNYGGAYYRTFNGEYDMFYPKNVYNSCALVTMTMLLQYYDRLSIRSDLIASNISYSTTSIITSNPFLYSKSERIFATLYPLIYSLNGIGENFDGAATYLNINGAFGRYFSDNNINCSSRYFTSYTNVKGAIDAGNPVIITVGAGRGFYKDKADSSSYESVDLSGHNVVAYGYTTNSLGIMDEFVVHANWHNSTHNYAKVYMNKLYSAGNCYLEVY